MTERSVNRPLVSYRLAMGAALFAGVFGLLLLLLPGMDLIAFLLAAGALGMTFAGSQYYSEPDLQRIRANTVTAFQGLFLALLAAYVIVALADGDNLAGQVAAFFSLHWPALTVLIMCLLLGIAGLRK